MTGAGTAAGRVCAAQAALDAAHTAFVLETLPIKASFCRHRVAWIVGGGLLGGWALNWLPLRAWARIGAAIGGTGALLARSFLTPLIAGALLALAQTTRSEQKPAAVSPVSD